MSGAPASALSRARAALGHRDFRRLVVARVLSQAGDGLFQAFLIDRLVFLAAERGTVLGITKAYLVLLVPFSLVGPLTGVVIDRWSRRAILVITPLVRVAAALALLALAGSPSDVPLYAPALIVVSANRFYLATAGAVMPALVPQDDLLVGNSITALTGTVATFIGLVAGTQVAGAAGDLVVLGLATACWPMAAAVAATIADRLLPEGRPERIGAHLHRVAGELAAGARRLVETPRALGPVVSVSVDQLLFGLITVLSVVVFRQQLNQGVASYGRAVGAGGVGILAGAATVGWLEDRLSKPRIMAVAFAAAGLACLAAAPRIVGPTILLVAFTLGLTYPWRKVPADTLAQESIPDRFLGRVFALYDILFSLPRVVAAALALLLVPRLSSGWLLALCGLAYVAWTPVPPWWVRRPHRVAVRFYAGSRDEERPRAVVLGGEEQAVEVLGSWNEELAGSGAAGAPIRRRRFRLRAADGWTLDVVEAGRGWRVLREWAGASQASGGASGTLGPGGEANTGAGPPP